MFAENTPLTCLLYVRELLMSTASRYFFPKALGCPHPPAKNLVLGQIEQKTLLNVTFRINALYFMRFTDENKCINSAEPMYMYIYRTLFFWMKISVVVLGSAGATCLAWGNIGGMFACMAAK